MTIPNTGKPADITYDDIPYPSYPFPYTRPEHLRTIGQLFGMTPPAIETARVLDIGCAEGGNMVNFAETYPKSYSLGVDLSKVQIDNGNTIIKALGFTNIELKAMSITDLDESVGKFDYIICHGVFSWVPDFVKDKILEITKKLLSPNGILFISYNTLPGWNMQKSIRDMMLFHANTFTGARDKFQQAKLFLDFVNESLEGTTTPYAKFLQEETKFLSVQNESYLIHEYLGEENAPFYFSKFMDMAAAYNLNYLGDSNLSTMYLGNLPAKASEKLQAVNDIVRTEQYMDFINNRKFRTTILCHKDVPLNRNIELNKLKDFYTVFLIVPAVLENTIDLTNEKEIIGFHYNNSEQPILSTASPIMKAIFYVYFENIGNPLSMEEIAKKAFAKLGKFELNTYIQELSSIMAKLVLQGFIQLYSTKPATVVNISTKPKVSKLARYQAQHASTNIEFVTNHINSMVQLQLHEKFVLQLLDGKNTIEQIKNKITEIFIKGELIASGPDGKISDESLLKQFAQQIVATSLEKFRTNYLLVG